MITVTTIVILTVTATVSLTGEELQAEDIVRGKLKLDGFISYQFHCAVCGSDCVLQIAVIHRKLTLPMPKTCPIPAAATSAELLYTMWDESPTHGHLTVRFEGNLALIRGKTGETLMEVRVEGFVK